MDYISNFIKPELLVLVPVLYIIGAGLKKSQSIADKHIPMLLGAAGVMLALAYVLATSGLTDLRAVLLSGFVAVTQGILCAGASVYVHEIITQSKKDE